MRPAARDLAARRRNSHSLAAELEALAATQRKVIRFTSAIEADWLLALVDKYGDDIAPMTRDRKLNPWQKTAGEIKRACVSLPVYSWILKLTSATITEL